MTSAGGVQPRANHHIRVADHDGFKQCMDVRCGIGAIPIDHYIDVRINLAKHALHNETFSLASFVKDDRAILTSAFHGVICRVVVEDVDSSAGQFGMESANYLSDRELFVKAWNQDGNFK